MSKKLQVTVEEPILEEIAVVMKREKFFETSEFVKHCIRHYLVDKSHESELNAPTGTAGNQINNPLLELFDTTRVAHPCHSMS